MNTQPIFGRYITKGTVVSDDEVAIWVTYISELYHISELHIYKKKPLESNPSLNSPPAMLVGQMHCCSPSYMTSNKFPTGLFELHERNKFNMSLEYHVSVAAFILSRLNLSRLSV